MQRSHYSFSPLLLALLFFYPSLYVSALELSPRQWSHLPSGIHFGGFGYAYTEADISFDPVLDLADVEMESEVWLAKYIHTFSLFDRTARIDLTQGYQEAEWTGLLQGAPAKATRNGPTDTFIRFSTNLYGAPALQGKEFASYRANHSDNNTIIGAGLVLRLPTGDYHDKKLLNLGGNRYVLRPQLGISRQNGPWMYELTTEASIFFDNNEFFDGNKLEQDPLYIVHAHLTYTFRPGLWLSAGAGYDYGGESKVNGQSKDDTKENTGWSLKAAYPLSRTLGITMAYVSTSTKESTGADTDSLIASLAYMW